MSYAFLDTDFIRKTKCNKISSCSLLEQTLSLNHDFYVSEKVYEELGNKFDIKPLFLQNKIKILKYEECFTLVFNFFQNQAIRIILNRLEEIINLTSDINNLYLTYFSHLENMVELNCESFVKEFRNAVNEVPPKNGIGEIITILLAILMIQVGKQKVFSFFSDDTEARTVAMNITKQIQTYNCQSVFILLKNTLQKDVAKNYAKNFKVNTYKYRDVCEIIDINYKKFIDMVYNNQFKIARNGFPQLKN